MKSTLFYLLILLVAIGSFWMLAGNRLNDRSNGKNTAPDPKTVVISINEAKIIAEIADTPALREQGLSGRVTLSSTAGLLFVFDQPGQYDFWMKEMNFPLDIIWLDAGKNVIDIIPDLDPSTYPDTVTSQSPAKYVLEVNAGYSAKNNVKIGDTANW